jgi:hypothetical protein
MTFHCGLAYPSHPSWRVSIPSFPPLKRRLLFKSPAMRPHDAEAYEWVAISRCCEISTQRSVSVKKLWGDGFMDSPKTHYKKSISTASEAMDEERGIKEFYPDLYELVKDSLLLNALFIVTPRTDGFSVTAFSMEPSKGCINFPRYSERRGDTDYVVNEILRHN